MNIVRLNTVSLNQAPLNHIGERGKGGSSGGGTPSYENGVYIQHINRKLYTTSEWESGAFSNDEANGVALITDNARFVIAKENIGQIAWSSRAYSLVDGILTTTDAEAAKKDFAGYENTQLMLATDTSGAGYTCANYTFPNGDKGYLPALGEFCEAIANLSAIGEALTLIGGYAITTSFNHWTSTQAEAYTSWMVASIYGAATVSTNDKFRSMMVRAFATLNF